MPSPFTYPGFPEPTKPGQDEIDKSKRYDLYCSRSNEVLVYRNVLIKGKKTLFPRSGYRIGDAFIELEQANGETIYISQFAIVAICEHGIGFSLEKI
jgi:hypothetical protein